MKKIYITRHGETNWNLYGITQGKKDSKLTEKGRLQTEKLASGLIKEKIQIIYSSHLERAKSTTMIISTKLKIPYFYEESLSEVNFGEWEGLTNDEIMQLYPNEFNQWEIEPHDVCIPGGEQLITAQKRIIEFFKKIVKDIHYKNILLVGHSAINKLLLLYLLDMNICNYYKLKQDNCCINIISFEKHGLRLLKYNDTGYLKT